METHKSMANKIAKVVPFLTHRDQDRERNIDRIIQRARDLVLSGFEAVEWSDSVWLITSGRLTESPGKRPGPASIRFHVSEELGDAALPEVWAGLAKALMKLRFNRSAQAMSSQRSFVAAIGLVWYEANRLNVPFRALNKQVLDAACRLISEQYAESTAYNLHKFVSEFVNMCDANLLCNNILKYKYSGLKRPEGSNSREQQRLDDPGVRDTSSPKMITPEVLQSIGALYQDLPKDHNCRIYVVMLSFLAFLGRRFSELALLPVQKVGVDLNGERFIYTFPGKAARGDAFNPKERVFLPSKAEWLIEACIDEFAVLSSGPRATATEMRRVGGPDIRFLQGFLDDHRFYINDLRGLGLPDLVGVNGWARKQGLTIPDVDKLTSQGRRPAKPSHYVTKETVIKYCNSLYFEPLISCIKIDGVNEAYYPENMLLLRYIGLSSGTYTPCVSGVITHAMFQRFIKHDLEALVREYVSSELTLKLTSHQFRHTINTLADEGGLNELMQTSWFDRSNPRDTKYYQHTSPAAKALIYREKIKLGEVGGPIAEEYQMVKVEHRDAFLEARVQGVHYLGPGMCTHSFSQHPCPKHLECQSACGEYSWDKTDDASKDEVVRIYSLQVVQEVTASKKYSSKRPGEASQWLSQIQLKLETLGKQLLDFGIDPVALKVEVLESESVYG